MVDIMTVMRMRTSMRVRVRALMHECMMWSVNGGLILDSSFHFIFFCN